MPTNRLEFKNSAGHTLSARLDLPVDGEADAYALFAHCFTCGKDLKAAHNIAQALNQNRIAVLRFDFTGLGQSEGEFADTNFSSNIQDLISAAHYLQTHYQAPQILIGHSLGGAAVLQAAAQLEFVRAVVTIAAPCDPAHVAHLLKDDKAQIEAEGEALVCLAGREFKVKKQFLDDLNAQHMQEMIGGLRRALLVLHSPTDNTVGVDNARRIFMAAKHPKSFISLDNADHLLAREQDSLYAGGMIAAWARKYVRQPDVPDWHDDVKDNRVAARTCEGLRTELLANGFALVADEPLSVGGTNTGPTPYDLLAAALGACTSMTLRMYADRKNWPLESVTVGVKHQKVHAQDSAQDATPDAKPTKLDYFERSIQLSGDLDNAQRERLLEIANRCPVHRTLESDIKISTRLTD